jgi:hypothetical protein
MTSKALLSHLAPVGWTLMLFPLDRPTAATVMAYAGEELAGWQIAPW